MVIFFFHTFISFWDCINAATKLKRSWLLFRGQVRKEYIPLRCFKCVTARTESLKVPACESMPFFPAICGSEQVTEIPSQGEDGAHSEPSRAGLWFF